jgi:hypothetical protein
LIRRDRGGERHRHAALCYSRRPLSIDSFPEELVPTLIVADAAIDGIAELEEVLAAERLWEIVLDPLVIRGPIEVVGAWRTSRYTTLEALAIDDYLIVTEARHAIKGNLPERKAEGTRCEIYMVVLGDAKGAILANIDIYIKSFPVEGLLLGVGRWDDERRTKDEQQQQRDPAQWQAMEGHDQTSYVIGAISESLKSGRPYAISGSRVANHQKRVHGYDGGPSEVMAV